MCPGEKTCSCSEAAQLLRDDLRAGAGFANGNEGNFQVLVGTFCLGRVSGKPQTRKFTVKTFQKLPPPF